MCIARGSDSIAALGRIPGAFLIRHVSEVSDSVRYNHVCCMMIGVVFV